MYLSIWLCNPIEYNEDVVFTLGGRVIVISHIGEGEKYPNVIYA